MTDFANFLGELKDWVNRPDLADSVVTRWVRFAEDRFSVEMRCREMVHRAKATLTENVAPLPSNCLDLLFVRYLPVSTGGTQEIRTGQPLRLVTVDEYYNITNDVNHELYKRPIFMRVGFDIFVNPAVAVPSGTQIEIGYHRAVEPFTTDATLLYVAHPSLYFYGSLAASASYLLEDDRLPTWEAQTTSRIQNITDAYNKDKYSGSPLNVRRKSFG